MEIKNTHELLYRLDMYIRSNSEELLGIEKFVDKTSQRYKNLRQMFGDNEEMIKKLF